LAKNTEEEKSLRRKALEKATLRAAEIPLQTAQLCLEGLLEIPALIDGNPNALSDMGVASLVFSAGMEGALYNVQINALGVDLSEQGMVQISMNMVDTHGTPLYRAFEFIKSEADHYGVPVVGSEIVGLVPLDAMLDSATYYLGLHDFSKDQLLEKRVFGF